MKRWRRINFRLRLLPLASCALLTSLLCETVSCVFEPPLVPACSAREREVFELANCCNGIDEPTYTCAEFAEDMQVGHNANCFIIDPCQTYSEFLDDSLAFYREQCPHCP